MPPRVRVRVRVRVRGKACLLNEIEHAPHRRGGAGRRGEGRGGADAALPKEKWGNQMVPLMTWNNQMGRQQQRQQRSPGVGKGWGGGGGNGGGKSHHPG